MIDLAWMCEKCHRFSIGWDSEEATQCNHQGKIKSLERWKELGWNFKFLKN